MDVPAQVLQGDANVTVVATGAAVKVRTRAHLPHTCATPTWAHPCTKLHTVADRRPTTPPPNSRVARPSTVSFQRCLLQAASKWRGAGVAVPVFSLRTKAGMGVGEFLDIKKLVDWAVSAGVTLVQILPINDTSVYGDWRDSYPYKYGWHRALLLVWSRC